MFKDFTATTAAGLDLQGHAPLAQRGAVVSRKEIPVGIQGVQLLELLGDLFQLLGGPGLIRSHPTIEFVGNGLRQVLRGRPPASLYRPSPRTYPDTLPPIEHPGHFIVKRVTNAGTVRFKKRLMFIANALKQHPTGIEEVADGIWSIYFCRVLLGRIDERDYIIRA